MLIKFEGRIVQFGFGAVGKSFYEKLSKETEEQLRKIRAERETKLNLKMEEERKKNECFIEQLKEEFAENHTVYAKEILKNILEV